MTNLDSILKSKDITLSTKVCLDQAMVFPVVMYGCESWAINKAELWRIDAFELWFWRRLLTVPWTTRRSNQSILKEISPECSLEGLMLKLKLQSFGHLIQRVDSLENTLMLGKNEGRGRRGRQRMSWLDGITDSTDMSLSKLLLKEMATHSSILAWKIPWTEEPGRLQSTGCKEPDMTERPHFYLSIFRELVMDRESCCPAVHGVPKSWTWLSDWTVLTVQNSTSASQNLSFQAGSPKI